MKVEIWSDIVCPWCFVGKRRFEEAVAEFDGDVEIEWKSFELDPTTPRDVETPLIEALARKYGTSLEGAQEMIDRMEGVGADEGIDFRFEEAKPANTFDAHRLLHFAKSEGLGDEIKERLLLAYFTEGRDITDRETLVDLGEEIGLDAEEIRAVLLSDAYATEVRSDELRARQIGVRGVPFFVIDEKYGVSGAQPPEAFVQILERAAAESIEIVGSDAGEACGPEGCRVDPESRSESA